MELAPSFYMVLCGFASGYPLSRAKKKSNILRTGLLVQRAAEWVEIEGIAPVHMRENKELRAWNCVPLWRLNRVWLPTPDGDQYKWMHDYLQELLNFPDAAYDDQVDATTLAGARRRRLNPLPQVARYTSGSATQLTGCSTFASQVPKTQLFIVRTL